MEAKRVKLMEITKELNIGVGTCIDELRKHGYTYSVNPNVRIGLTECEILREVFKNEKKTIAEIRNQISINQISDFDNLKDYAAAMVKISAVADAELLLFLSELKEDLILKWQEVIRRNHKIRLESKYEILSIAFESWITRFNKIISGEELNLNRSVENEQFGHDQSPIVQIQPYIHPKYDELIKLNPGLKDKIRTILAQYNHYVLKCINAKGNLEKKKINSRKSHPKKENKENYVLFSIVNVKIVDIIEGNYKVSFSGHIGYINQNEIDHTKLSKPLKKGDAAQAKIIACSKGRYILSHKAIFNRIEINPEKINVYVIDTNIFLIEPNIIKMIDDNYEIVIPASVITEIDYNKGSQDASVKKNVKLAIKNIEEALTYNSSKVKTIVFQKKFMPSDLDERNNDDKILTVAIMLYNEGQHPILLTNDVGLQLKARAQGITTISLDVFKHQ